MTAKPIQNEGTMNNIQLPEPPPMVLRDGFFGYVVAWGRIKAGVCSNSPCDCCQKDKRDCGYPDWACAGFEGRKLSPFAQYTKKGVLMAHENLKGISGLICFLNHPLRESKVADDGEHGEAYHRLMREAHEEYSKLIKSVDKTAPCRHLDVVAHAGDKWTCLHCGFNGNDKRTPNIHL